MVAYLHKASGKVWTLTLVAAPCNGPTFEAGEKITVSGKREASAVCKVRGAKPWNF